jgi:hypothetical protein
VPAGYDARANAFGCLCPDGHLQRRHAVSCSAIPSAWMHSTCCNFICTWFVNTWPLNCLFCLRTHHCWTSQFLGAPSPASIIHFAFADFAYTVHATHHRPFRCPQPACCCCYLYHFLLRTNYAGAG